jgi:hypothetical protein
VKRDANSCQICDRPSEEGVDHAVDDFGEVIVTCPLCGKYQLGNRKEFGPRARSVSPRLRKALSCATRQASEGGQLLDINSPTAQELADMHARTRVNDNIDKLLLQIAKRADRPGARTAFDLDVDYTLIDCEGEDLAYYENGVHRLLAFPRLASERMDALTSDRVAEYITTRQAAKGRSGHLLQVASLNRELQVLRRMFVLAEEWGKVEKALPRGKMLPGERHRERVLTAAEEDLYFMGASNRRHGTIRGCRLASRRWHDPARLRLTPRGILPVTD